jgi:hypothetical protein
MDRYADLYAKTVPKVRALIRRVITFYEACARRGWHVWVCGDEP